MLVKAIMLRDFPFLNPKSNTREVEDAMLDLEVFHLPIAENGRYKGMLDFSLISKEDLLTEASIFDYTPDLKPISVGENEYVFELIERFVEFKLSAIAVVSEEGVLIGLVRREDFLRYMENSLSFSEGGTYITLQMGKMDYNLQEIARIVESNDSRILFLNIDKSSDPTEMLVSLKVNTAEIRHILATFERFGYQYIAHSAEEERDSYLKERYDLLMKYLDI